MDVSVKVGRTVGAIAAVAGFCCGSIPVNEFRIKQSLGRTWLRRPDLLERLTLNNEQKQLLEEFQREYLKESGVEK